MAGVFNRRCVSCFWNKNNAAIGIVEKWNNTKNYPCCNK